MTLWKIARRFTIDRVVADTSFLVALLDSKDVHHQKASDILKKLSDDSEIIFPDVVLVETIGVLARRCREQKRPQELAPLVDRAVAWMNKNSVLWTSQQIKELFTSIARGVSETQGELNFHDVLIVHIARRYGLRYIVSFDADFDRVSGLTRIKEPNDLLS